MTQVSVEHIAIDDRGVARLVGRRIKVKHIVVDMRSGMTPDEIQAAYPHLTLAEIYAALAYYYDHQSQIDAQIVADDELVEELRKQQDPALLERLRQKMGPRA